jgi:hypothetical protein
MHNVLMAINAMAIARVSLQRVGVAWGKSGALHMHITQHLLEKATSNLITRPSSPDFDKIAVPRSEEQRTASWHVSMSETAETASAWCQNECPERPCTKRSHNLAARHHLRLYCIFFDMK